MSEHGGWKVNYFEVLYENQDITEDKKYSKNYVHNQQKTKISLDWPRIEVWRVIISK